MQPKFAKTSNPKHPHTPKSRSIRVVPTCSFSHTHTHTSLYKRPSTPQGGNCPRGKQSALLQQRPPRLDRRARLTAAPRQTSGHHKTAPQHPNLSPNFSLNALPPATGLAQIGLRSCTLERASRNDDTRSAHYALQHTQHVHHTHAYAARASLLPTHSKCLTETPLQLRHEQHPLFLQTLARTIEPLLSGSPMITHKGKRALRPTAQKTQSSSTHTRRQNPPPATLPLENHPRKATRQRARPPAQHPKAHPQLQGASGRERRIRPPPRVLAEKRQPSDSGKNSQEALSTKSHSAHSVQASRRWIVIIRRQRTLGALRIAHLRAGASTTQNRHCTLTLHQTRTLPRFA